MASMILGGTVSSLRRVRRWGNGVLELRRSWSRRFVGVVRIEGLAVAQGVILSVVHCCCVEAAISDEHAPTKGAGNEGSFVRHAQRGTDRER